LQINLPIAIMAPHLTKEQSMNIIKALSFYMEQQGWTKAELNRQSGVNLATISLVMNGHRGASLTTMKMWSDSFGIPLSEFIKAGE
jgi:transcriptional regulator with XRE-family HTH domain